MHPLAKLACRSAGAKAKGTGASASRVKRATSATSRPGGQPAQRHGKERSFERKRSLPSGHSSRSARLVACATSFRRQSKIRDRACVEALLKPLMVGRVAPRAPRGREYQRLVNDIHRRRARRDAPYLALPRAIWATGPRVAPCVSCSSSKESALASGEVLGRNCASELTIDANPSPRQNWT
jgi:hypothetical protein